MGNRPPLAGVTCSPREVYKSQKITRIADRGKEKWLPRHVGAGLSQPYSQAKIWFLIERYAEIVVIIRSARLVGGRVGGRGSFLLPLPLKGGFAYTSRAVEAKRQQSVEALWKRF